MKKMLLYLAFLSFSLISTSANASYTQRAQALVNKITSLFKKPAPSVATIKVGYIPIKGEIREYATYFLELKAFADNPEIDCILVDINSHGGSGATAQIIADYIISIKQVKPVICFISDVGASAAYAIASACSYILSPSKAFIGSIGTVWSNYFDKKVVTTSIASGKFKVPTYSNEGELDEEYREYVQEEVDAFAEDFFQLVAENRNLSLEFIKGLEAKAFNGKKAQALGLIDEVGTLEAVIQKITSEIETKNNGTYEKISLVKRENYQPKVMTTFTTIH